MEHIRCFLSPTPSHCCRHHCDWFHPAVFSLQEIHINQWEYGNFIPPRSNRLTDSILEQKGRSIGKKLLAHKKYARHCTLSEISAMNIYILHTPNYTSGDWHHKHEHLVIKKGTLCRESSAILDLQTFSLYEMSHSLFLFPRNCFV